MIKLEIKVQPKSNKYLEFSQTLNTIAADIKQLCPDLLITEEGRSFLIIAKMDTPGQLTNLLYAKELNILSGAIRTLAEKSEVTIFGIGHKRKGNDLREIRLNYLKRTKKTII